MSEKWSTENSNLNITAEECGHDRINAKLEGVLLQDDAQFFKDWVQMVMAEHHCTRFVFDCTKLEELDPRSIYVIQELSDDTVALSFVNMNQDCFISMWGAGLEGLVESHIEIPSYETTNLYVIGEGANGKVYRIDDEIIMKTFRANEPIENILKEKYLLKCAFIAGVPCPISFGLAFADGRIALLMEMVKSRPLSKVIREDEADIDELIRKLVDLVKKLHEIKGDRLTAFPRKGRYDVLLKKADSLDEMMDESHRGRLRKILEDIDTEEVLVHGDPQPKNIRVAENGLSFIDLETISTGPDVMDVGAMRRSLFCDWEFSGVDYSEFMKLSKEQCIRIWELFTKEYYKGMDEKEAGRNLYLAELIGDIYTASQFMRRGQTEQLKLVIERLKTLIDLNDKM